MKSWCWFVKRMSWAIFFNLNSSRKQDGREITRPSYSVEASGMKVFLTGAPGFIGNALLRYQAGW